MHDKNLRRCGCCRKQLPKTEFGRVGKSTVYEKSCRTCLCQAGRPNHASFSNPWSGIIRSGTSGRWEHVVGCTADVFNEWVEDQFTDGMSWDNHGEWQFDHVWSLYSYDFPKIFKSGGDIVAAMAHAGHYTNISPLWKSDNTAKSFWCGDRKYEPFCYTPVRSYLINPESKVEVLR